MLLASDLDRAECWCLPPLTCHRYLACGQLAGRRTIMYKKLSRLHCQTNSWNSAFRFRSGWEYQCRVILFVLEAIPLVGLASILDYQGSVVLFNTLSKLEHHLNVSAQSLFWIFGAKG